MLYVRQFMLNGLILALLAVIAPFVTSSAATVTSSAATVTSSAAAENLEQNRGRAIMQRFTQQENGFGDFRGDVTMVTREKTGKEFQRHMEVRVLEDGDLGEKRLFVFDQPRTLRGTTLLSHTMNSTESQWIYLPAFKRVKRISSHNKASAFVSSEFSYEDLTSIELDKYQYQYLRDEKINGKPCHVVKMIPLLKGSGYQSQIAYIDTTDFVFRQIDYYDRNGKAVKTLSLVDYQQYLDRFWRPLTMTMVNHQNGRATTMTWSQVAYGNGFAKQDFHTNALKRRR